MRSLKQLPVCPTYTYTTPILQSPTGSFYFANNRCSFFDTESGVISGSLFEEPHLRQVPRAIALRLWEIRWKNGMATLRSLEQSLDGAAFFSCNLHVITCSSKSEENPDDMTRLTVSTNQLLTSCRHDRVKAQWISLNYACLGMYWIEAFRREKRIWWKLPVGPTKTSCSK